MASALRVLQVLAADDETGRPAVWAERQVESLHSAGVQSQRFLFRGRRSLSSLLHGGSALRAAVREHRLQLVHVHYAAAQAVAAVLFSPVPVVISFCGSDLLGNYNAQGQMTRSGRLSILLSRIASRRACRCIAKSRELAERLPASAQKKCAVIPNGIDLQRFRPMPQGAARAELGWQHDNPVVLFMERDGAWVKDPRLAHSAAAHASAMVPHLRMEVVSKVPPDQMPLYHNASDVLLLTSRHEGSSNTLKEALACSLPVVSVRCGDAPERLEGVSPGYLAQGRSAEELGAALASTASLRARSNGPETVQHLSIERVAERIAEVYREALH